VWDTIAKISAHDVAVAKTASKQFRLGWNSRDFRLARMKVTRRDERAHFTLAVKKRVSDTGFTNRSGMAHL
jgi:hypothetical protein